MKWWNWLKRLFQRRRWKDECRYIQGSETLPQPLSEEEQKEALIRWSQGSYEARDRLIEHNLRLVVYIAKRYESNPIFIEDLISIGTIGLIKAIQTYDLEKNIKLVTYASRCIENEILMYLRKKNKWKMEVSFDEPLNVDYDGNELLLSDIMGTPDDIVEHAFSNQETARIIRQTIRELDPREQTIVCMRYGINHEELTQKDIAAQLGISQSYISRLEKRIINKMKQRLQEKDAV